MSLAAVRDASGGYAMKTRTKTTAYSQWRQAQEWLGEWLLALAQGRCAVPRGAAIRRALGLKAGAKARDVEAKLRAIAAEPTPVRGDTACSLGRLERVQALLSMAEGGDDESEASFLCAFCGESTPIEVDPEDGETQSFTVDCSVCCRPNVVRLLLAADGTPRSIEAEA